MLTLEQFKAGYPDFSKAGDAFLIEKLDEAALEVDPAVCGAKTNTIHGLKTARKLALSPFGKNARMVSKDGGTVYDSPLHELIKQVAPSKRPLL